MGVSSDNGPLRLVMIGPLPPPLGGISVSQAQLVEQLRSMNDVAVEVVDISAIRNEKGNSLAGIVALARSVYSAGRRADVLTAYMATPAVPVLGLMLLIIAAIIGKPLVLRKAANTDYNRLGIVRGRVAHFVIRHCSLYLAETKNLVDLAARLGIAHVDWFPTSRPMPRIDTRSVGTRQCRRFVFVGQVRAYKGVLELIEASERFEDGVEVHVYGPILDDIDPAVFEGLRRTRYQGVLSPEDVVPKLAEYDVFLLPTKALTEGYPGAIFESYAAGIPVVTTRCGAIPEIVNERSGLFVEPGSADALYHGMRKLVDDDGYYRRLCAGVLECRMEFDSGRWATRFKEICAKLCLPRD